MRIPEESQEYSELIRRLTRTSGVPSCIVWETFADLNTRMMTFVEAEEEEWETETVLWFLPWASVKEC